MERHKTADVLRNIARYMLLVLGSLVFYYTLFSEAKEFGDGISGIIKNIPNALPGLFLLVLVFIAWKWELVGGIIITLLGIGLLYINNFRLPIITFILILLFIILGSFLIRSWYLRQGKKKYYYH